MGKLTEINELPGSWLSIPVKEVITKPSLTGKKLAQKNYLSEGRFPVIDQGREFIGGYSDNADLIVETELPVIVFGDHTKAIKFVNFDFVAGADGIKVLKPCSCFLPKLFFYFLQAVEFPNKGYARHFQLLENCKINLPPLAEQSRIVAKIEELLTKLYAGVEELKKVEKQIKRFRQAVLCDAVTGQLTKAWREENQADLEPAGLLLQRVLKERREYWELEQLKTFHEMGKNQKSEDWKKKYKEPVGPITASLSVMPEGWVSATVEQMSYKVQYGSSAKTNEDPSGIPVLRMGNIFEGNLIIEKLKYLPKTHSEFPELILEEGELLFNRTNSAELVGKTAVYNGNPTPCSFASYLIKVKLSENYLPEFLCYFINSLLGKKWIASVVNQQVGQANVNGAKLQALSAPLPPLGEQVQIKEEVERLLSIGDTVECSVRQGLKQAERLRQSILKRAFGGKLVPQDPTDESAECLLERIHTLKDK